MGLSVPERAWCTFEITLAHRWGIYISLWFFQLPNVDELLEKITCLDLANACASDARDVERIQQDIMEHGGFSNVNQTVRAILTDRIKFVQAMDIHPEKHNPE